MSAIASPIPGISVRRPSSMRRSSGIGSAARLSAAREYALARYGLPPRSAVRCAYSRRSFATVVAFALPAASCPGGAGPPLSGLPFLLGTALVRRLVGRLEGETFIAGHVAD